MSTMSMERLVIYIWNNYRKNVKNYGQFIWNPRIALQFYIKLYSNS